jgi:hypothetical protein
VPSDVYACLQDVPINKTLAVAQIEWLENYMQFQSTLAYLKNPLPSYPLPAVDIISGLESIRAAAATGNYSGEYDFEFDTWDLLLRSYDGHILYTPFLIGAFSISRNVELVSISTNGTDLPKVYMLGQSGSDPILNISTDSF